MPGPTQDLAAWPADEPRLAMGDLAGLLRGSVGGPAAGGAPGDRHGTAANLRWVASELSTLVQGGADARVAATLREPMRPRGTEAVQSLLAYLDAQEAPRPRPAIPGLGRPGGDSLVTPAPGVVPRARTRLTPRIVTSRPPRSADRVQGEAVAGSREYVVPKGGPPRVPDVSIQPLATMPGGQPGSGSQTGPTQAAEEEVLPPYDKLRDMAQQVLSILDDWDEKEMFRIGD